PRPGRLGDRRDFLSVAYLESTAAEPHGSTDLQILNRIRRFCGSNPDDPRRLTFHPSTTNSSPSAGTPRRSCPASVRYSHANGTPCAVTMPSPSISCTCTCGSEELPEFPHSPSCCPAITRAPGTTRSEPRRRCASTATTDSSPSARTNTWFPSRCRGVPKLRTKPSTNR